MNEQEGWKEALRRIETARRSKATDLDLAKLRLQTLPESLFQLTRLEKLNLFDNGLSTLPGAFAQLTQLQELDLSSNQLAFLPESLGQLINLQQLHLGSNQLAFLPESLGQLINLQQLHLANNQLSTIPESLGLLSQLQSLELFHNQFTALPESVGQLNNLAVLHAFKNELSTLPESISQLKNLKTLSISENKITALPESLGQLNNLKELQVHGNRLSTLPESIGQLKNLQEIYLGENRLEKLPESVGELNNLRHLYIFTNRLASLPDSIGQLSNLERLVLGRNKLGIIPESIGRLTKLHMLDLTDNEISTIPKSLTNLQMLDMLLLHGNPGLDIPKEILGPTWIDIHGPSAKQPKPPKEIFDYLFSKRRPLNEAKLILVGQGGVGKTSLVKTLTGQKFKKGEKTTQGIKIKDWQCTLSSPNQDAVTVHIWDFGGQEIMHATHQFFLTPRSLYLLVLNWRPGSIDREADYWFRLVRASGGEDAPVIVVLNKQKNEPFDVNQGGWLEKYAGNIKGFAKTDCEDAKTIKLLKQQIFNELKAMKSLKASFPERWFAIKVDLSQMKDQFVTYTRYRQICTELGESDPEQQAALAGFLHDLGIALNYKDDPRLRFAYVLKPEWVTEGIYAILHAFRKSKGLFTRTEAAAVLEPKGYEAEAVDFILGLMDQFEVSFPLSDGKKRILIPQLLDDRQPSEASLFDAAKCLNFGYKYEIVPEGLLPRFIVRTHHISEERGRWKSGVILRDPDSKCRALVRADSTTGLVSVQVDGPEQTRVELLAIIRYNFQVIHADSKLKPAELVYPPGVPQRPQRLDDLEAFLRSNSASTVPIKLPDETVINPTAASLVDPVKDILEPLRLFLSYSHEDKKYVKELQKALKPSERNGLVQSWYDGEITAGEEWKPLIEQRLAEADIIVCQLSRDFLSSDFCVLTELAAALQRREKGEIALVAYVLHDCDWKETELEKFQILPHAAKPIDGRQNKHKYWMEISDGIKAAVKKLRQGRPAHFIRDGRRGFITDKN